MMDNIDPRELLYFAVIFIGLLLAIYFAEIKRETK